MFPVYARMRICIERKQRASSLWLREGDARGAMERDRILNTANQDLKSKG